MTAPLCSVSRPRHPRWGEGYDTVRWRTRSATGLALRHTDEFDRAGYRTQTARLDCPFLSVLNSPVTLGTLAVPFVRANQPTPGVESDISGALSVAPSVPRCSFAFSDQGRSRSTGRRRPPRFRPGRRLPEHSPAATLSVVGSSVAREDRSAGLPHLRGTAWVRQCEGCDLNAWTPTGADLESAAVSWLGYPRTLCRSRRALSAHQCVRAGNIKHYDFGCVLLRHRIYLMLHGRSDRSCATRNDTKSKQSKFPD